MVIPHVGCLYVACVVNAQGRTWFAAECSRAAAATKALLLLVTAQRARPGRVPATREPGELGALPRIGTT